MNILDESKSLIENISLLSGPILAILGFAAVIQLRLTKKSIITASMRQAAELSSKQVEVYNNKIIPLQDKLFLKETELKVEKPQLHNLEKFLKQEITAQLDAKSIENAINQSIPTIFQLLIILNNMEAFSTYFTKGVADEEIAYSAIGRTFCHTIDGYSFDICILREDDETSAFNNLIELYKIWNARLRTEKISKELKFKQNELQNIQMSKITILGTK